MLRWMTGVSLSERKSNECVRSMLAIDDVAEVMRRNRLRWFGHVERRDELCWIKRIETLQVDGDGVEGRPRKRWREVLKEDMRKKGLCREDAWDMSHSFVWFFFDRTVVPFVGCYSIQNSLKKLIPFEFLFL